MVEMVKEHANQLQCEAPFPLTAVDRENLRLGDDEVQPHTWEDLKQIIVDNRLEVLKRWPSDARRYLQWSTEIKARYGNVQDYIVQKRLKWTPSPRSTPKSGLLFECHDPRPLQHTGDFKILPNDWPYGMENGIVHLVVWSKVRMEAEPVNGDMTPATHALVDNFVRRTFIDAVKELPGPAEKVLWFKNWTSLQSVRGIDHVHILVRYVPQSTIDEWTNGEQIVQ